MKHFNNEVRQTLIIAFFSNAFGLAASKMNLSEVKEAGYNLYITDNQFNKMIDTVTKGIMQYAPNMLERENEKLIRKVKDIERQFKRFHHYIREKSQG